MISDTGTILAKTTEVVSLQSQKGIIEEDSSSQIVTDCFASLINNGTKILSPSYTKPLTTCGGYAWFMWQDIQKGTVVSPTFNDFLGKRANLFLAYSFTISAWLQTVNSIFCDDPISRANDRGYSLQ